MIVAWLIACAFCIVVGFALGVVFCAMTFKSAPGEIGYDDRLPGCNSPYDDEPERKGQK